MNQIANSGYRAGVGTSYTIGQLAKAAGVPTTTVRYYERRGLLRPAGRMGSGDYRVFGSKELERLKFVRAAQATGFSLKDIATLLSLRDGVTRPCKEVQALIEERLTVVAQRLKDLQHVHSVLKRSLKICRQFERTGRCQVIDRLNTGPASAKSRPGRR